MGGGGDRTGVSSGNVGLATVSGGGEAAAAEAVLGNGGRCRAEVDGNREKGDRGGSDLVGRGSSEATSGSTGRVIGLPDTKW